MKQPIKKRTSITKKSKIKKSTAPKVKTTKRAVHHPKYGTSKLEEDFARDFLDKLGVKYIYQFEAKDIGRWFDFKIINGPIIEIQGSYWHGDSRIYEEKDLNKIQKKNIQVDAYKQKWALSHGIPIYYIWEKDVKESPDKVMAFLKEILYIEEKKKDKNKRHINKFFQ
jgi:hypothetical protein